MNANPFYLDYPRRLLIFLFMYTATSKLYGFTLFQAQLSIYPILHPFSHLLAWFVPLAELALVALLVLPATTRLGLLGSLLLLTVFTCYLTIMVSFFRHLPCSCGGVLRYMSWRQHIFFNLFFILCCIAGLKIHNKNVQATNHPLEAWLSMLHFKRH